jgi:hypothetical protein
VPRYRRQIAPGSVQHIVSRFVDREFRFSVPGARDEYLRRAGRVLGRSDWRALAFGTMSSHVHWALRAGSQPSSAWVKPLHAGFAQWLNTTEHRLGPVFADRHRSLTFEGETVAVLVAYIHNNPVRAGVVSDPTASPWTSHRAYLGLEQPPSWLDVELGLWLCGFSATAAGRQAFHRFVLARASESRSIELSGGDLQQRRTQARATLASPVELASPVVGQRDGALEVRVPHVSPDGCSPRAHWVGSQDGVLTAVAKRTGVTSAQMRSRARTRNIVGARRLALVVWSRYLSRPTVQMAAALCLADSSAAKLLATASDQLHHDAAALARALLDNNSSAESERVDQAASIR